MFGDASVSGGREVLAANSADVSSLGLASPIAWLKKVGGCMLGCKDPPPAELVGGGAEDGFVLLILFLSEHVYLLDDVLVDVYVHWPFVRLCVGEQRQNIEEHVV